MELQTGQITLSCSKTRNAYNMETKEGGYRKTSAPVKMSNISSRGGKKRPGGCRQSRRWWRSAWAFMCWRSRNRLRGLLATILAAFLLVDGLLSLVSSFRGQSKTFGSMCRYWASWPAWRCCLCRCLALATGW